MNRLLLLLVLFTGCCHPRSDCLDPNLSCHISKGMIQTLPSSFPPLDESEVMSDWGRELVIGNHFAPDLDLYRAITAFKRARILLPKEKRERLWQIDYDILLSYFLGEKYQEVTESFEESSLGEVTSTFPAFRDLLIILYESYKKTCHPYRVQLIRNLIESYDCNLLENFELYDAISRGDLPRIDDYLSSKPPEYSYWLMSYRSEALSVRKAQTLNALLPGAGYLYTGQRGAALTSLLLNATFIAAAVEFFVNGYTAAGIITTGFEMGWYFGGINGAGLSAKYYNEQRYQCHAAGALSDQRLFPLLMLNHAF